ncbi:hypothetical protein LSH36_544g06030 [Paralvinella palmiformis]|uniref:Growth factor receptor-bound protein 14 n=1 Tax=Paralvinella palmiformis TaxID=53620 RepID=A0AAD9J711_9ANNE|nr:hypothetical protein LSH36_544g06030 [Paralvinella palmiformis]
MSIPVPPTTLTRNPFPELSSPEAITSPTISQCHIYMDTSARSTPSSSPSYHGLAGFYEKAMSRTQSDNELKYIDEGSTLNLVTRSSTSFDLPGQRPVSIVNPAYSSEFDLHSDSVEDSDNKLMFFSEDNNSHPLAVDYSMQASDICQALVEKNHVRDDINWVIAEYNTKLKQERFVEDHEILHNIQRQWPNPQSYKMSFRKDFRKFEVFRNPAMVDASQLSDCPLGDLIPTDERYNHILLQHLFNISKLPDIQGHCLLKDSKRAWKKVYCVLKSNGLYYSNKGTAKDIKHLVQLSSLADINIYTVIDPEKTVKCPHSHCICIKRPQVTDSKQMIYLGMEDEKAFLCWYTALRLVKYGSRLCEDYKAAVNNLEKAALRDTIPSMAPEVNGQNQRVAMDFSQGRGRVVADPDEALAAASEEACRWRKKVIARKVTSEEVECDRPSFLTNNNMISKQYTQGLGAGVHMAQPWFHSGISRQESVDLITKHGLVDGVFLVRESHSIHGVYVLSLAHNYKVKHCQIHKYYSDGQMYYSLDGGHTKFLDLIQLVEFYQLNAAGLPTRLTYYVTRVV